MSTQLCSKRQADRVRLASYLTVGVAGAMMATDHSEAAVVAIDLTNVNGNDITGVNGGVTYGQTLMINDWLGSNTGDLWLYNTSNYTGLFGYRDGSIRLELAITGGDTSLRNFGSGDSIDSSASWSRFVNQTTFRNYPDGGSETESADFGPGSFMGFRFSSDSGTSWNYGYLEVTWTAATNTFQIRSGGYEEDAGTGILAGAASPAAVPGAGLSAMALMALGGGAFRRRSRGRVA